MATVTRRLSRAALRLLILAALFVVTARGIGSALPDGGQIAFQSTARMVQDIYLYDLRSAKLYNATRSPLKDERAPTWSPDGDAFLYVTRGRAQQSDELFLRHLHEGTSRQITPDGSNSYMPSWSPDGSQVAYVIAYNRVAVMPIDDASNTQMLIRGYNPHWSPDGTSISYTGTDLTGGAFIGAIQPDGGGSRFLSVGAANFMDANWSPDGERLVVVGSRARALDLYLLEAGCLPGCQAQARRLTNNLGNDHAPEWSQDGEMIVYTCAEPDSPRTDICLLMLVSGEIQILTSDLHRAINDSASWRP